MKTKISHRKKRKSRLERIEEKYGKDFGSRSVDTMVHYFREKGYPSLAELFDSENGTNYRKDK
ncbi:MAG: hypothetical protein K9I94_02025 [Bacteroidales bacterium]|nr:hypothetical protein [Bacteroidales bacterium]